MNKILTLYLVLIHAIFIQAQLPQLWGTATSGGTNSAGTIFTLRADNTNFSVAHNFGAPDAGAFPESSNLCQATNGLLYGMTSKGGAASNGNIFSFNPATRVYTDLVDFTGNTGAFPGLDPWGSLIQARNGLLYGMTQGGGATGNGVIFSFDPATNTYSDLYEFPVFTAAYGTLLQLSNGLLYGMTSQGGAHSGGYLFSFNLTTNQPSDLFDFTNGSQALGSLIQASNGKLYGMTQFGGTGNGNVFSFDTTGAGTYTDLYDFTGSGGANPGSSPNGDLLQAKDGKLYGMAANGGASNLGVLFSFTPGDATITDLLDFNGATGDNPYGNLIQAKDGNLYGMTFADSPGGDGSLFSFTPGTKSFNGLVYFSMGNNGSINGGANPSGSLFQASNDSLYGMTLDAGKSGSGNLFSFNIATGNYIDQVDFENTTQGSLPWGTVMHATNGLLYGITNSGGTGTDQSSLGGDGVVYSLDPATDTYTELYDFESDGSPYGNLMQANNGLLYGLTFADGLYGRGTIFSIDPATGVYTDVFDFSNLDKNGVFPYGSLIQARNGLLYGMTSTGGGISNSGWGEIFSFNLSSGVAKPLYNFNGGTEGSFPYTGASLVQATNGLLYGMTGLGGTGATPGCACGQGVIFRIDTLGNNYKVIWNFDGATGGTPTESLIQASNGLLYGMTNGNNSGGTGVLFSIDTAGNYTDLVDFDNTTGDNPYSINGTLLQASDGKLYGSTTDGGANGHGTVFQYNYGTDSFVVIRNLNTSDGARPFASFIEFSLSSINHSIATLAINGNPLCAAQSIRVPFTATGAFLAGNIFTAQLSDASGSFSNPVNIGNITTTTSDTINATIPVNTPAGSGFRIRVISSNPSVIGTDNGTNITIKAKVTPLITVLPDTICSGNSSLLTSTGTSGTLQWQSLSGNNFTDISNADSSHYNTPPLSQTTAYRLVAGIGGCPDTSASVTLVVKPSPAPPNLSVNDSLICASDSALIQVLGTYYSYHWNNGDSTSYTTAHKAGAYWVTVANTNGCSAVSGHVDITVYPVSSVSVQVEGDTLSSIGALKYQWYINDSAINGATLSIYVANEHGFYSVAITDTNGCISVSNKIDLTGIASLTNDVGQQVSLFPNPLSGAGIQLSVGSELVGSALEVYDDNGRMVFQSEIRNQKSEIALNVSSGVYWLRIYSEKGVLVRKLVRL